MHEITVIGPGRLGGALAIALSQKGFLIERFVYRSLRSARAVTRYIKPDPELRNFKQLGSITSPILLIATPDPAIRKIAGSIAHKVSAKTAVLHTSGALSSDILEPLRERGCAVASFHPLASVSSFLQGSDVFSGVYFCLEGDPKAVRLGKHLARSLGGKAVTIDARGKTLYHAGAVCAAGHTVALFDVAIALFSYAGIRRREARRMLAPLLATTAGNLAAQDTPSALTGTFARLDLEALDRQISSLRKAATTNELDVFLALAERSLQLAESNSADKAQTKKMRERILLAKPKRR